MAYDLTYGAFFTVQVVMALDAAINLLGTIGNGLVWLGQNAAKMFQNIAQGLQDMASTAGQGSAVGDPADPINVDVDIDIDIDVDVDVDVDIDVGWMWMWTSTSTWMWISSPLWMLTWMSISTLTSTS